MLLKAALGHFNSSAHLFTRFSLVRTSPSDPDLRLNHTMTAPLTIIIVLLVVQFLQKDTHSVQILRELRELRK